MTFLLLQIRGSKLTGAVFVPGVTADWFQQEAVVSHGRYRQVKHCKRDVGSVRSCSTRKQLPCLMADAIGLMGGVACCNFRKSFTEREVVKL